MLGVGSYSFVRGNGQRTATLLPIIGLRLKIYRWAARRNAYNDIARTKSALKSMRIHHLKPFLLRARTDVSVQNLLDFRKVTSRDCYCITSPLTSTLPSFPNPSQLQSQIISVISLQLMCLLEIYFLFLTLVWQTTFHVYTLLFIIHDAVSTWVN